MFILNTNILNYPAYNMDCSTIMIVQYTYQNLNCVMVNHNSTPKDCIVQEIQSCAIGEKICIFIINIKYSIP